MRKATVRLSSPHVHVAGANVPGFVPEKAEGTQVLLEFLDRRLGIIKRLPVFLKQALRDDVDLLVGALGR